MQPCSNHNLILHIVFDLPLGDCDPWKGEIKEEMCNLDWVYINLQMFDIKIIVKSCSFLNMKI